MSSEPTTSHQRLFRWGIKRLADGLALIGYGVSWFMGRIQRPKIQPWHPTGGQNILVLAPHPDDETGGCAGTIHNHKQAGDHVTILFVTNGGRARSWLSPTELAKARHQEAKAVCQALAVDSFVWLDLPELEFQATQLIEPLLKIWQTHPSDLVYSTSWVDFHPDHHKVAVGLAMALQAAQVTPVIRLYQAHVPLTPTLINVVVPVAADKVREASMIHETQAWSMWRTIRMKWYAGFYYGVRFAEVFWEMPAKKFIRLYQNINSPHIFQGLRFLPLTDPMAYIAGKKEREHLKNLHY